MDVEVQHPQDLLKMLLEKDQLSTPTRLVENFITTKGLQDRNIHILDGTTVENKGKTIH